MSTPPFITQDGSGTEVQVSTGYYAVESITPDAKGINAKVKFKRPEHLRFDISAWIPMKEPVFKKLEASMANDTPVSFRIESQRRPTVSRDIPYEELKKDAGANLRSLLVYVDGEYTSEHVTLEENDPFSNGRVVQRPGQRFGGDGDEPLLAGSVDPRTALDTLRRVVENKSFNPDVIAALTAQALLAGVSEEEIFAASAGVDRRITEQPDTVRPSFSPESPSWSEFNKDGRPNLGSLTVQAGVGVEKFVRSQANGQDENAVRVFSDLILAIADRVQEGAYGTGFRVDRGSSSHSTIRGLIYDTIGEQGVKIPFGRDLDAVKRWVAQVGSTVRTRFTTAISIAEARHKFTDIYADYAQSVLGGVPAQVATAPAVQPQVANRPAEKEAAPAPERSRESQSPNEQRARDWSDLGSAPAGSGNDGGAAEQPPAAEPVAAPETTAAPISAYGIAGLSVGVPTGAKTVERAPDYGVDEVPVEQADAGDSAGAESETEGSEPFEQTDVAALLADGDIDATPATEETLKALSRFVNQAEIPEAEQHKVGDLLRWTFGDSYAKAKSVPDQLLDEFVNYYVMTGTENFKAVLDRVTA